MNSIKNKQDKSINNLPVILLSVVVSCKGVGSTLLLQLEALKNQSLDKKLWQAVFLFREETAGRKNKASLKQALSLIKRSFPFSKILFLKEEQPLCEMRNLAFEHLNSPYLYFIDEDIILEDFHHLSRLIELHQQYPELTVLGGSYLNHPNSTFWGNCYNWIVRLWVKAHKTSDHKDFVPAGNLSVKHRKTFQARFYTPCGFGAEELYFLKELHQRGLMSYADKALDVPHLAQHTFRDFIQRAWLHGKNLPQQKAGSKRLFFKEPAGLIVKMAGLFYLLLTRISAVWSQLKFLFSKTA
ncbi:MAG: glycosyltransferase family A protein [Oligoflexia bacterium]|nr:glycosyltransferase family A protein [Oligoflexia bacterium]